MRYVFGGSLGCQCVLGIFRRVFIWGMVGFKIGEEDDQRESGLDYEQDQILGFQFSHGFCLLEFLEQINALTLFRQFVLKSIEPLTPPLLLTLTLFIILCCSSFSPLLLLLLLPVADPSHPSQTPATRAMASSSILPISHKYSNNYNSHRPCSSICPK